MALIRTGRDSRRRGASRRRKPIFRDKARFDRWLDRLVDVAVIVALAVGAVALAMTLLL
ncbi:hypothetical protein [Halomonas sp.]|jgi:hypothetical protein|uniref:hypothetical protein n=1 Tax=Halomonas sp. TaxID=1486246 RepID=UPI00356520A4